MTERAPSGIVSFLFTDIEGSARLWAENSHAMSTSLAVHDEIVRETIGRHGGRVFATGGDAFTAAFHTTTDALDAAVAAQIALSEADWPGPAIRVRMGIHAGEAEERDGDYFGPVLNKAARIMSAANAGQILLSSSAADLSSTWLSDETYLTDAGAHLLADAETAEHLFLAGHTRMPIVDKAIRTSHGRQHNLTEYLTTFVGREAELELLADLVADHRLVTLTGVGGTGKTRLAVEVGGRLLGDFEDGCWIVELAPVTNPDLIMATIGDVFDLRPGPGIAIADVVTRHLSDQELLLIIDNCEHLLDAASEVISTLLHTCPHVTIVATSRESIGISGESIIRVPSLGLPTDSGVPESADAVNLFMDRAREMRSGFEPTRTDMDAVARICTRIDGIPLGLELAAARMRSLSPEELADRLEASFRVLSGATRTALPRQQTLSATIDWSFSLLTDAERSIFRRMARFLNGFDLAAAEAVCSCKEVPEAGVLDLVDSLVDKSLVVPSHDPIVGTRYRMLEPVRQFAQERLSMSGEADDVRMAHAHHYARHVAEVSPLMRGVGQMRWERRLDEDYDNLRAAFTSLLEAGEIDAYLDMAFDLFSYWQHVGFHLEGIPTIEAGLAAAPEGTDAQRLIKGYFTMAALGFEITLPRSVDDSARGLDLAEATGDLNLVGRMELAHGAAIRHATLRDDFGEHVLRGRSLLADHPEPFWWEPEWEAAFHDFLFSGYLPPGTDGVRDHAQRAIETFERLGDHAQLVASLCESAMQSGGDADGWIMGNLERAIEMVEWVHVPYWAGHAHMFMGILQYEHGANEAAAGFLTDAVQPLEDSGDIGCWSVVQRTLAGLASMAGDQRRASRLLRSIAMRADSLPPRGYLRSLLVTGSLVLADAGEPERAAVLLGWVDEHFLQVPTYVPALDQDRAEQLRASVGRQHFEEGAASDVEVLVKKLVEWLSE